MPLSEIEFLTFLMIEKVIQQKITGGNLLTQKSRTGHPFNTRRNEGGCHKHRLFILSD